MKHPYLLIWLTYCTSHGIAFLQCCYVDMFPILFLNKRIRESNWFLTSSTLWFFFFFEEEEGSRLALWEKCDLVLHLHQRWWSYVWSTFYEQITRNHMFFFCFWFVFFFFFKEQIMKLKEHVPFIAIVQDTCRTGVWLGWHICYNATQVSQGQLRENRNLSWSIRAKAALIYVLSVPVHNVNQILHFNAEKIYFLTLLLSLCVKARPSDPLVYVWILWCFSSIVCSFRDICLLHFCCLLKALLWWSCDCICHVFSWLSQASMCVTDEHEWGRFTRFMRLEVSEKLPQG